MKLDDQALRSHLTALGDHLQDGGVHLSILVVGGAALAMRGWVQRTTEDVDVLALVDGAGALSPPELPSELKEGVRRVARDFGLDQDWLNTVVGAHWQTGLPDSAATDIEWLELGGLRVGLASRETLLAMKLHAAADHGDNSVHLQDLVALRPDDEELESVARWVLSQDLNQEEFPRIVRAVLDHVRKRRDRG